MLLALIDGVRVGSTTSTSSSSSTICPQQNLVILGIAVDPNVLDPALRRPGRLDVELELSNPSVSGLYDLFRGVLKWQEGLVDTSDISEEELKKISAKGRGFVGSDVVGCVKECVRKALLETTAEPPGLAAGQRHQRPKLSAADLHGAVLSTPPSSLLSVTVEVPSVPWDAIGGMLQVKRSLEEAINYPVKYKVLYDRLGIPYSKGVLLYGPPGCSKTLLARALATSGTMNFLAVKGPELLSKWLGESERMLAQLFKKARAAGPCVIFFDEIDAIGSKRGGGGNGGGNSGGERLLSQLLTEIDGVNTGGRKKHQDGGGGGDDDGGHNNEEDDDKRVIVVGATNRPDLLDPALVRAGRIDKMIYVPPPDLESRIGILQIGMKGKAVALDVDLKDIAQDALTGGFSGAEVVGLCREACMLAIEEGVVVDTTEESPGLKVRQRHLVKAAKNTTKQITEEMLAFYRKWK